MILIDFDIELLLVYYRTKISHRPINLLHQWQHHVILRYVVQRVPDKFCNLIGMLKNFIGYISVLNLGSDNSYVYIEC